jgi:hypothetical protein
VDPGQTLGSNDHGFSEGGLTLNVKVTKGTFGDLVSVFTRCVCLAALDVGVDLLVILSVRVAAQRRPTAHSYWIGYS